MSGFPAISQHDAMVLILGSMPSRQSLSKQQYYAHPRNSFWWIMGNMLGFDPSLEYRRRCLALIQSKIALWDVLLDCQRAGSLDSAIVRSSEQANDFADFFETHSKLRLVAFNGGAAKTIFERHHPHISRLHEHIKFTQLPSTSPAHAAMNRDQKLTVWISELSPFLNTINLQKNCTVSG